MDRNLGLQVGQRWENRKGWIVTIIEAVDDGSSMPFHCNHGFCYTRAGVPVGAGEEFNLVERVDEPA